MRRTVAVALAALVSAAAVGGAALAQNVAVIEQRKALLKAIGDGIGPVGPMLRREQPFQIAPVHASLDLMVQHAPTLRGLFPADSRTGGTPPTRALPPIWERNAEFLALFDRLGTQARAARAAITDEATFRANMPGVLAVCGECHRPFRAAN